MAEKPKFKIERGLSEYLARKDGEALAATIQSRIALDWLTQVTPPEKRKGAIEAAQKSLDLSLEQMVMVDAPNPELDNITKEVARQRVEATLAWLQRRHVK